MALESLAVVGNVVPRFGNGSLIFKAPNEVAFKTVPFGCASGSVACRGIKCFEDDKSSKPSTSELQSIVEHKEENNVSKRLHKDLTSVSRQLTSSDFSAGTKNNSKLKIAFKGLPGSFSEDAALKAYQNCQTVPCDGFEDTFKAVELWLADKAVLPIENSTGGSIHRNYDLLLRHRLHIVGEVQLAVNLCLLALPGIRAHQLKRVISHPQALACCDVFLSELSVAQENAEDTSGAAQYIAAKGLREVGVIASARAAEIYGLNLVAERIQDDADNITRFLVLAMDPIIPRADKPFKTSIVFTLDDGPGILFKALAVFAMREINLTKIESRPQRMRPLRVVDDSNTGQAKYFDYLFYIDFEASMAELRAQNALEHLQEFATFIRVLGCYAMDTTL